MNKRVIARIDVKNEFVIKGIHLEGLRKIGDPNEIANRYYCDGIDEIIFMDAVAAYYDRNNLSEIISKATENIFVPITVGGGIRSLSDINIALKSGADKVAINTQGIKNPNFLSDASRAFGSQAIVASIDAKKTSGGWLAYTDNGREPTMLDVVEWLRKVQDLGVGEILLTSIDQEGTKKGFDIDLINAVEKVIEIPLIISGGAGSAHDCLEILNFQYVDAIAIASILHYQIENIGTLKEYLHASNIGVRL